MRFLSTYLQRCWHALLNFIGSAAFFWGGIILFSLQASWLAYSNLYPLPFDEYYHYGIITIYSHQWSPFIHSQPLDAGLFGDITRMPSYVYHYLMSFPYRFLDIFINGERSLIVSLRLMNVAMMVGGMVLFRKLLVREGITTRVVHLAIIAFAFTPIITLLAAHINYDNMMFLLTPVLLTSAVNIIRNKGNLAFNLIALWGTGLITVMVKHSFAPILAIVVAYLLILLVGRYRKSLYGVLRGSVLKKKSSAMFALLIFFAIIGTFLFAERYGGNILMFGKVTPPCEIVQSKDVCSSNTVWSRNQENLKNKPSTLPYGPREFAEYWVDRMIRGYFAVFSHAPQKVISIREPYGPIELRRLFMVHLIGASIVISVGVVMLVSQLKGIWRDEISRFFLTTSVGYLATLFLFNVIQYINMGKPEAIQARYTVPLLIPVFILIALSVKREIRHPVIVGSLLVLMVLHILTGGIVGRLYWNPQSWLWPEQTVITTNSILQDIIEDTQLPKWQERD